MIISTSFRLSARKLASPTSAKYNEEAWEATYAEFSNQSDEDRRLFETAKWIAAQATSLRTSVDLAALRDLGKELSTILAVAICNMEYRSSMLQSREAAASAIEKGAVALDHLIGLPLKGAMEGQRPTSAAHNEVVVDTAESWLFDAGVLTTSRASAPDDLSPIMLKASGKYSIQHSPNDLWNQALFEGWYLHVREDGILFWIPSDPELAMLSAAWLARKESNFIASAFMDFPIWAAASPSQRRKIAPFRTVVDVGSPQRRKLKVGLPRYLSKRRPMALIELTCLKESYLSQFLDIPFPKAASLTIRKLVIAWSVIIDLANALDKQTLHQVFPDEINARSRALIVGAVDLSQAIGDALSCQLNECEEIIRFLTFRTKISGDKGHRGLWSTPLVPVGSKEADFALVLPSLETSSTLRKCEAWAEKGGLSDELAERGNTFEKNFRKSIGETLLNSPLLQNSGNAPDGIRKTKFFPEQIDLLFFVGNIVFIGEIKFHITPADSIEKFYHFKKLNEASLQAIRKAQALKKHPEVGAAALNLDPAMFHNMRFVPMVVDSQSFGFAQELDGCFITEAQYLITILRSGSITTQGAFATSTAESSVDRVELYTDLAGFENNIDNILKYPLSIRRLLKRYRWDISVFPTANGVPLNVMIPFLEDLSGQELAEAKSLMDLVS